MPTRKEVAKVKADYIEKRDVAIGAKIDVLQQDIYEEVLADFINKAKKDNNGLSAAQLTQLQGIVKRAMDEQFPDIMREVVKSAQGLGNLNLTYFSTLVDSNRLDEIRDKTEKILNRRLGIDDNGNIVRDGFIDRSLASKNVQKKFVNEMKQLVAANADIQTARQKLKDTFTGTDQQNGLIKQHFNTFAKDILNSIDRSNSGVYANELDLNFFYYEGGLIKTSRSFCVTKNGKIFSRAEAEKWKDSAFIKNMYGQKIDDYDPLLDMGGYGCLHSVGWITNELAKVKKEQNLKAAVRNANFKDRNMT